MTADNANKQPPRQKISKRAHLPPFMAMDVMRLASEKQAAGEDVIHLEVGQPASSAPQAVMEKLVETMAEPSTHGYGLPMGQLALRTRLSQHYQNWYGLDVPVERLAITVGSSTAFAISFMAAFDEGDEIAIPVPGYPAYRNLMLGLGLKPVNIPAGPDEGWMPKLKEMESWDRLPDGLMIASPHNPTGVIIPPEELRKIARWCDEKGVRLISDEIYHGLNYSGECDSVLRYTKNAIIVNSLSKYFSMTGWRIGWMIVPEELVQAVERLAQNLYIAAPTPNQMAAVMAFDCKDELDGHTARYKTNREILLSGLSPEFLGNHAPCDGAFYLYADVSALTDDSIAFAAELLEQTGVATTPGVDFDPENGHRYLRLSFAGATESMHEAVKRINGFVETRKITAAE